MRKAPFVCGFVVILSALHPHGTLRAEPAAPLAFDVKLACVATCRIERMRRDLRDQLLHAAPDVHLKRLRVQRDIQLRPAAIVRHPDIFVRGNPSPRQRDGEMNVRVRIESFQEFDKSFDLHDLCTTCSACGSVAAPA